MAVYILEADRKTLVGKWEDLDEKTKAELRREFNDRGMDAIGYYPVEKKGADKNKKSKNRTA